MVANLMDKAGGLLGLSDSQSPTDLKPEYRKGDPYALSTDIDPDTGAFAPQNQNQLNMGAAIEFVHYGRAHQDSDKNFAGKEKKEKDPNQSSPEQTKQGHALIFRDSLEREAILLHGFIFSCKKAVQEFKDNQGLLGMASEVADVASGLLGGDKKEKPDPAQLDKYMTKIKESISKINVTEIKYANDEGTHEAGKNLHQTRANYSGPYVKSSEKDASFTEKLEKEYLPKKEEGGGDLVSQVKSFAAKGINLLPWFCKIPFKIFDIWIAMYLYMRWATEDGIADQSYKLTMDAIKNNYTPTFPLWFNKDPNGADDAKLGKEYLDKVFEMLEKGDDDKQKREKEKEEKALDNLSDDEKTKKQSELAENVKAYSAQLIIHKSFIKVLDAGDSYPDCLETPIKELTSRLIEFMKAIYAKIMKDGDKNPIEEKFLLDAGKEHLSDVLMDMVGGGQLLNDLQQSAGPAGGLLKDLNLGQKIKDELSQNAFNWTDEILKTAIGSREGKNKSAANPFTLITILTDAHKEAKKQEGSTMEVYLSRLPWLFTLMFRNTFFPCWSLLIDKTVGAIGGPYKDIMDGIKKAQGYSSQAKGYAKDAQNYAGMGGMQDGVKDLVGDGSTVGKVLDLLGSEGPAFPLENRKKEGKGKAITQDDIQDRESNKVETT